MSRRIFQIATKGPDDAIELHPMKKWLRKNPVPGIDPDDYTWAVRDELKKRGWSVEETDTEVRLIRPGLGLSEVSSEEDDENEITFTLERDLQRVLRATIKEFGACPLRRVQVKNA